MQLFFDIGYVVDFNSTTQQCRVKLASGEIVDKVEMSDATCLQYAPIPRPIDLQKGDLQENQVGTLVLVASYGHFWRKVVKVWQNASLGKSPLYVSSEEMLTKLQEQPTKVVRKPRQLQSGEVVVQATAQYGSGNLGSYLFLDKNGGLTLKSGDLKSTFSFDSSGSNLSTSDFNFIASGLAGATVLKTDVIYQLLISILLHQVWREPLF